MGRADAGDIELISHVGSFLYIPIFIKATKTFHQYTHRIRIRYFVAFPAFDTLSE